MKTFRITQMNRHASYVHVAMEPVRSKDYLDFLPGQYATISFKDEVGTSPVRSFSIVSSPTQPHQVEFGFRVTGAFTERLAALRVGHTIKVQGAFGDFVLQDHTPRAVLIAGGIGITPFMSMLRYAAELRPGGSITLLYACKSLQDVPFAREIQDIVSRTPNIKVYLFVKEFAENDAHVAAANGMTLVKGPISITHLKSLGRDHMQDFTFYICGPKSMMSGLSHDLDVSGVSPFNIITESFNSSNKFVRQGLSTKQKTFAYSAAVFAMALFMIMSLDVYGILPKDDATAVQVAPTTNTTAATPVATTPVVTPATPVTTPTTTPTTPAPTPTTTPVVTAPVVTTPVVTTPVVQQPVYHAPPRTHAS